MASPKAANKLMDFGTDPKRLAPADRVTKANPEDNLIGRVNGLCTTLAACEELLEAIDSRVAGRGQSPEDGGGAPQDNSLNGAVSVAAMRAESVLANLRALASFVGA
jgi:hypothetical protein